MKDGIDFIRILDFLAELGTQESLNTFISRFFALIPGLCGFDHSSMLIGLDPVSGFQCRQYVGAKAGWIDAFNRHYGVKFPIQAAIRQAATDWNDHRESEFVSDFMRPQGIRYSLGTPFFDSTGIPTFIATLNRGRTGSRFSDKDEAVLRTIQPHVSNYLRMLRKIERLERDQIQTAELVRGNRLLSRREAEVASHMLKRFTAAEIASLLFISPATVRKHIQNIHEKLNVSNRQELLQRLLERG